MTIDMPPQPKFARPQRVRVQVGWPREDQHFTPLLADNLDWLEIQELGPLTLTKTEVRLPGTDRALDLLAETTDGRKVAIENQYLKADHDHLTRGIAYAVGLQARALVIVAESHGQEFTAVADYLNRCAEAVGPDEAVAVFLVVLTLEQVGEWLVPRFEVLTRPNSWRASAAPSPQRRPTLDEFRARLDDKARGSVEEILQRWTDVPGGTIAHDAAGSVGLYLPNPAKRNGRTCTFSVSTNGILWFNRGLVLSSPAFAEEAAIAELDAVVSSTLGNLTYGPKGSYGKLQSWSTDTVVKLARWIAERFQSAGAGNESQ
jgi:hypothetical protein